MMSSKKVQTLITRDRSKRPKGPFLDTVEAINEELEKNSQTNNPGNVTGEADSSQELDLESLDGDLEESLDGLIRKPNQEPEEEEDIIDLGGDDSDSTNEDSPAPKRCRMSEGRNKSVKDPIWKQFTTTYDKNGKAITNTCNNCGGDVSAKACRMIKHVQKCKQQRKLVDDATDKPNGSAASSSTAVAVVQPASSDPFPSTSEIRSRMKVWKQDAVLKETANMDMLIGKMIFSANLPFSFSTNSHLQTIVNKLQIPKYKIPNPQRIGGVILDNVFDECVKLNKERFKGRKVVLSQDGWSTNQNAPVICHTIQVGKDSLMFDAVPTKSNKKDAKYCLKLLKEAIAKAEAEFGCTVVGVVTDNCNVMKLMRNLAENELNVHAYGCVAHVLNLLGQDLTDTELIEDIVKVQKYFRNHHYESASLLELKGSRPVLPGKTRWNSQLDTLESYVKNHLIYLRIARDGKSKASEEEEIVYTLNNGNVYANATRLLDKLKPVAIALDKCQADSCTLSDAVAEWLTMKSKLPYADQESTELLEKESMVLTSVAIAAYMLHPKHKGKNLTREQEAVGFKKLKELHYDLPLIASSLKALDEELFPSHLLEPNALDLMSTTSWWRSASAYSQTRIKKPALSACEDLMILPASTAALERAFSTMGNIITKKRNRLGIEKALKLAVVNKSLGFTMSDGNDSDND